MKTVPFITLTLATIAVGGVAGYQLEAPAEQGAASAQAAVTKKAAPKKKAARKTASAPKMAAEPKLAAEAPAEEALAVEEGNELDTFEVSDAEPEAATAEETPAEPEAATAAEDAAEQEAADEPEAADEGADAKPGKRLKPLPGTYNGKSVEAAEWADCAALEKRLSAEIIGKLKGIDSASIQAFIGKPANRLLLAQWHLAHREVGAGNNAFKQLLDSGDPATAELVRALTNNLDWMEKAVYSGECIRPGRALAIMDGIRKDEKLGMKTKFLYDKVLLDVATATALEWARSDWNYDQGIARARFYMLNHKDKRFHKCFKDLPFWMYRVICGCKGNNANGSVQSLEWALDNVHLPDNQYPDACWYANYLSDNLFGDSIHGPYYYSPYDDVYGANAVKRSLDVGGVCGSLSHFGAFAALGNGIPAMAAGEPGHCAYIVWQNNRWTPAYSLSWERGLHWSPWNGNDKFSSLHMATDFYAPAAAKKATLSNACRTLADVYACAKKMDKACNCYRAAVKVQPLNYLAWVDYINFLYSHKAGDAAAWKTAYKELSKGLAPVYPEMAAQLLHRLHGGFFKACPTAADRLECFREFWKSVKGMGPDRWAVEQLCNAQADSLKGGAGDGNESSLKFYTMAIAQVADDAAYAPVILAWGNNAAAKMDEKMQHKFLKATLAGLSKGSGMDEGSRDKILNQAILGAEKMRDRSSFQAIGKLLPDKYRKNRLPKVEPFPGKLVSQGGMLYASSTCQHDWPAEHWGVLELTGGRFHTNADKDAWVVVELPKMADITGVVTICQSNRWRLTNMKVQYSQTGKDDDWHDAGAMPHPTDWETNRLDLTKSKPRARFIRILRPGGPECFHLNGIFVYGTPAS